MADNTPLAVALALAAVAVLAWRVRPSDFRKLRWTSFALASGLFWGALSALLFLAFWESYYAFFAPPWQRTIGPFVAAALYSLVVLVLRWLARSLPGNPTITFCVLGGLESLPEHALGIARLRILEIPMLQGSTPGSILLFAFFEYVIFWAVVLFLTSLVQSLQNQFARHGGLR